MPEPNNTVIIEPCETLTSPDGYTLTSDGQRVLRCIAGGTLLLLYDPSGQTLAQAKLLVLTVGCAGYGTSSTPDTNPLTGILKGLFGK